MSSAKVNFTLPEETVVRLRALVSERRRSAFVALAIEEKLRALEDAELRAQLETAYQERADEDREMNKEWEPATLEKWPGL